MVLGSTTIEKYDLRTNTWVQVGVMNGRRLQFGVAVIDNKLYVVGGRDGLKTSNMVECYNPISKVWSTMPPMSTHRHGLGECNLLLLLCTAQKIIKSSYLRNWKQWILVNDWNVNWLINWSTTLFSSLSWRHFLLLFSKIQVWYYLSNILFTWLLCFQRMIKHKSFNYFKVWGFS